MGDFNFNDAKFFEQVDTLMDEETKFVFMSKLGDVKRIYDVMV